jgi:hypothetical protein
LGIANNVLTSNGSSAYWAPPAEGGGGASTYSEDVGDGVESTFTITHSLDKESVVAVVRENSSGYYVYPDIKYVDVNSVVLEFLAAPTTNQYKVIVLG